MNTAPSTETRCGRNAILHVLGAKLLFPRNGTTRTLSWGMEVSRSERAGWQTGLDLPGMGEGELGGQSRWPRPGCLKSFGNGIWAAPAQPRWVAMVMLEG